MNTKFFIHWSQLLYDSDVKGTSKIRLYIAFLMIMLLGGTLILSSVKSLFTASRVITSTGSIVSGISPLHAVGKYLKDLNNNTVWLRGVGAWQFNDDPDAIFMGNSIWNVNNVKAELDAMKSWGINVVRSAQAVEHWKYDMNQPNAGINHRQAIKTLLTLMAERGMYFIYTGYQVTDYWHGGNQDPFPYPPYQTSRGASSVIANQQEFVDWWASIATELKDYPNVLFELWNEPHGDITAAAIWVDTMQKSINAIRATGAQQPIIAAWDMACWVNLNYPPPQNQASTMDWVFLANLNDTAKNLIYTTHYYTTYGHIGLNGGHVYDYDNIKLGFQYFKFPEVLQSYPLLIGEFAANMDTDTTNELIAFDNTMKIFEEWHIQYTAWVWRDALFGRLHGGPPSFAPTLGGSVLKTHLAIPPPT